MKIHTSFSLCPPSSYWHVRKVGSQGGETVVVAMGLMSKGGAEDRAARKARPVRSTACTDALHSECAGEAGELLRDAAST